MLVNDRMTASNVHLPKIKEHANKKKDYSQGAFAYLDRISYTENEAGAELLLCDELRGGLSLVS